MRALDALLASRPGPALPARGEGWDFDPIIFAGQQYLGQLVQQTWAQNPAEPIGDNFGAYVMGALQSNSIVSAVEMVRMMVFSEARFQWQEINSGRPGSLFGTQGLLPLEKPWTGGTTDDFLKRFLLHADFAGNGYASRVSNETVLLRPDWTDIILEKRMAPLGRGGAPRPVGWRRVGYWHYDGGDRRSEPATFLADEVAHFAPIPDPLATYRGMSWLTPVIREVQIDAQGTRHKGAFFEHAATPNMAVSLPRELTPDQFRKFVDAMEEKHAGVAQAWRTLYTAGGADVTRIGQNMQELDYKAIQGAGETRIANAGGVHPVVVGLSEGMQGSSLNAGNYQAAKRSTVDRTIWPLWRSAAGSLETIVPPPRPGTTRLWVDARDIPYLRDDAKDVAEISHLESQTIRTLGDAGYEPASILAAVAAGDWSLLKHSGLYSVQLQKPNTGTIGATGA